MKVYSLSHFYESAVISVSNNPDLITRIVIVYVSFFTGITALFGAIMPVVYD